MTVAAVIVTYNRKELLLENLEMLFKQTYFINKIIIIDNHSSDGTREAVYSKYADKMERIQYEFLKENIGGAGGFEFGCKYSYNHGYDFVWLMDDDGKPKDKNTLSELIKIANSRENKFLIINSLVTEDSINLSFGLRTRKDSIKSIRENSVNGIYENAINPFNGTLVSKDVFEKIGFPNGQFFIKGDENDFTNRARTAGVYIATIVNSIYLHPAEQLTQRKILGKKIVANIEAPWKEYYKMRNYTYMKNRDYGFLKGFMDFLKAIVKVMVSDGKKLEVIWMILRGFRDGCKGNLGPTVKP